MRASSTLLVINQSLKLAKELKSPLEADRSWLILMPGCGLRHDRTDEVVSEDVCPNFFAYQLRCLATQDVHLQGLFHRA